MGRRFLHQHSSGNARSCTNYNWSVSAYAGLFLHVYQNFSQIRHEYFCCCNMSHTATIMTIDGVLFNYQDAITFVLLRLEEATVMAFIVYLVVLLTGNLITQHIIFVFHIGLWYRRPWFLWNKREIVHFTRFPACRFACLLRYFDWQTYQ